MVAAGTTPFAYVEEKEAFLALFPHRYDFIYAPHPDPKHRPDWHTENRYPLSDRQLLKGEYLYGVRFEKDTEYFLLDIDRPSPYHPLNDPLALDRLIEALEPLGITHHITCTSSDSQGLHLYFPIAKAFNSWKLAKAIELTAANAGFKLKLGQLEVFPNPKAYATEETPSLFNAHRLPLQMGSYILNEHYNPTNSSQTRFVQLWNFCKAHNSLNKSRIRALLKRAKQISYRLSNKASKFLYDLNTEIEAGWTDQGQTNRLLGRITMRAFVFNHVTSGGEPLTGEALIDEIVEVATALPGYKDWCRHQHEIEDRASEWARCIENSHYFPYGSQKGKYQPINTDEKSTGTDWNQKRSQETQDKITAAVQQLKENNKLPEKATARFKALLEFNIGGASLYRYRELWHPIELKNTAEESELQKSSSGSACTEGASAPKNTTSLLSGNDSNSNDDKAFKDKERLENLPEESNSSESPQQIRERIWKQLAAAQEARKNAQAESPVIQNNDAARAVQNRAIARMREFLLSGEPILLSEVGQWLLKQPPSVREALVVDEKAEGLTELLVDLAAIAQLLVEAQLSPWDIRLQLEERYEKSLILDLTEIERHEWVNLLARQRE